MHRILGKPVLAIGILFMAIFLMQLESNSFLFSRKSKLKASSCRALLVKLDRLKPEGWKTSCNENNLELEIVSKLDLKGAPREELYRELANHLSFIANASPSDNLERTFLVSIRLNHPRLSLSALTEGKDLVMLAKLNHPEAIAHHLRATVQTSER